MRKFTSSLIGIMAFTSAVAFASPAFAGNYMSGNQAYSVELNKTEIVRLPSAASAVVIGNPSIADVSVHAADTLFVVGRGYGETNLIVLDVNGQTIMDADIQVLQKYSGNGVRVYNRSLRQTYNCAPNCQPSPILGDDPEYLKNFTSEPKRIISSEALSSSAPRTAPISDNTLSGSDPTGRVQQGPPRRPS